MLHGLLLCSLIAAIFPASPVAAQSPGAFIDLDDDGVWDASDLPLAPFVGSGAYGFNAYVAQPGYSPSGRPVGLVIDQRLLLGASESIDILVTGHIRVRADIVVSRSEVMARFTTVGGDVDVAPGVTVSGRGDLVFETRDGGDIRVGDGGRFATRGDLATVGFDADGTLTVGAGVELQLRGGGYAIIVLHGRDGVTMAPGVEVRAPAHGSLMLLSGTDLALSDLRVKAGYIDIEAYTDAGHPEAKRIAVTASRLQQSYKNGDFRMIAAADLRGSYAPHAIVLTQTDVRTKAVDGPMYVPLPEIR